MKRYLSGLSVVVAGIVGALVALLVVGTGGSKTVTTVVDSSSGTSTSSSGAAVPSTYSKTDGLNVNAIYKRDINGVVDIDVTSTTSGTSAFGGTTSQQEQGEGAGVVYDKQGDIITDEHVVANATSVTVNFQDGKSYKAKVLGSDPNSDVGVIRVDAPASELHPIAFANSSTAQVGDPVIAIGSPFGLPGTVTSGIVSAVGRSIAAPNGYVIQNSIQTDAAINPGNSGGPLLDAAGQVLGLNDQIETSTDQNAGIGFATSANADVQVANEIIAGKTPQYPYLGVCLSTANSGGVVISASANSSNSKCTTTAVTAGSPAAKAGLRSGDIITAIDGKTVASADSFTDMISAYKPGDTITLTVKRDGKTLHIKAKLGTRPKSTTSAG